MRTPCQTDPDLRDRINAGETGFFDMHLSVVARATRHGLSGKVAWGAIGAMYADAGRPLSAPIVAPRRADDAVEDRRPQQQALEAGQPE